MANLDEDFQNLTDLGVASNLESLQQRIRDEGLWSDFFDASTGQTLLEVIASELAEAKVFGLQHQQESFLSRARLTSSVVEIAQGLFNFDPDRAVWSTTTLWFYLGFDYSETMPELSTDLSQSASSGDTVIIVDDTSGFQKDDVVLLQELDSNGNVVTEEEKTILSVDSSTNEIEFENALNNNFDSGSDVLKDTIQAGINKQVPVNDVTQFDANRTIRISEAENSFAPDDLPAEDAEIKSVDATNSLITVDLDNSYTLPALEVYSVSNVDIPIPRKTVVVDSESSIPTFTTEPVVLNAGEATVSVSAAQGEIQTTTIQSTGEPGIEVELESSNIAEDGVEVFVDGERWSIVDTLLRATQQNNLFESVEVETNPDFTLTVVFGNGTQGRIPSTGSTIRIDYVETQGPNGTVFRSDSITGLQSTITNVNGTVVNDIQVTNRDVSLSGGAERQDKDEIRIQAPRIAKTGQRAVTTEDYNALARDFPSVSLANAVGERRVDPPNPRFADKTTIYVVRERDQRGVPQPVNDEFAFGTSAGASEENPDPGTFLHFISVEKGHIDVVDSVEEAELLWFFIRTDLFIPQNIQPSVAVSNVKNQLNGELLSENNAQRNIGETIRESQVFNTISDISQVSSHHTKLIEFARKPINEAEVVSIGGQDHALLFFDSFETPLRNFSLNGPFKSGTIDIRDFSGNLKLTDDHQGSWKDKDSTDNFESGGNVFYRQNGAVRLTDDANSGDTVISVVDAEPFDGRNYLRLKDRRDTTDNVVKEIDSVDLNNDTVTLVSSLSDDYLVRENARALPVFMELPLSGSLPSETLQFEFQTEDPRPNSNQRDGDILTKENQFAIYDLDLSEFTTVFE